MTYLKPGIKKLYGLYLDSQTNVRALCPRILWHAASRGLLLECKQILAFLSSETLAEVGKHTGASVIFGHVADLSSLLLPAQCHQDFLHQDDEPNRCPSRPVSQIRQETPYILFFAFDHSFYKAFYLWSDTTKINLGCLYQVTGKFFFFLTIYIFNIQVLSVFSLRSAGASWLGSSSSSWAWERCYHGISS